MKLLSVQMHNRLTILFIGAFLFFLPVNQQYSLISIFLIIGLYLISGSYKYSLFNLKENKPLQLICIFYIIYCAGMLYSVNKIYGASDLETKLTLIIFPLILSGFDFSGNLFRTVCRSFIVACLFSAIFFFILSLNAYFRSGDISSFFYKGFSHWFHPAYLSLYFNLAIIFLFQELFISTLRKYKYLIGSACFILLLSVLLMSSRTASAVTFITVLIYPLIYFRKKIFVLKIFSKYIFALISIAVIFLFITNKYNRYAQVSQTIEKHFPVIQNKQIAVQEEDNSTTSRIKIWHYAVNIIRINPLLGVGTGDIKDVLQQVYEENNFGYAANGHLNAHNQYLNTAIALGITGLVILILLFLIPGLFAVREQFYLFIIFLLITSLNFLTESMLERQAGVLFFSFFYTVFSLRLQSLKQVIR